MIRIANVKVSLDAEKDAPLLLALKKIKAGRDRVISWRVSKKSVDARDKENVHFVMAVDIALKNEDAALRALRPGIAARVSDPAAPAEQSQAGRRDDGSGAGGTL